MAEDIFKDIICPDENVNTTMVDGNDQCIPSATFIWIGVISLLVGFTLHVS